MTAGVLAATGVAPLPAAAQGSVGDTSFSCMIPVTPVQARALRRALTKSTGSTHSEGGVKVVSKLRVLNSPANRDDEWMMSGEMDSFFTFAAKGPFGSIDAQRFGEQAFNFGVVYKQSIGAIVASGSGVTARYRPYSVTARAVEFSDTTVTKSGSANIGLSGTTTRAQLQGPPADPNAKPPGAPEERAEFGLKFMETRSVSKRSISAVADLPADVQIIFECRPELGALRMGHRLLLNTDVELDTTLISERRMDSKTVDVGLNAKSRSGSGVLGETRRTVVEREALEGRIRVKADGSGLLSVVNLEPGATNEGDQVPFLHRADLVFQFDVDGKPLITRAEAGYDAVDICATGNSC